MNELVQKLSVTERPVEATRIDKSLQSLQESIDRNYVHILFSETGTELGVKLEKAKCNFDNADFKTWDGIAHFEGGLTLNYVKVRVIADIALRDFTGKGHLMPVTDDEYRAMM